MKGQRAKRIKDIRGYLGMTQAEMAKEIGVNPLTVSQWEIGFRQPSSLAMKAVEMLKELRARAKSGLKRKGEKKVDTWA